jgi:hypothetical protein
MQSTSIITIIKMMESLPEPIQTQVVTHLRDYIAELQDENQWDYLFEKTSPKLIKAVRDARHQIAEGLATPFDESQL